MDLKLPALALITLLCACSNSREVVHNGPFQQRKYVNKGWFLDLPSAKRQVKQERVVRQEAVDPVAMDAPAAVAAMEQEPLELTVPTVVAADASEPLALVAPARSARGARRADVSTFAPPDRERSAVAVRTSAAFPMAAAAMAPAPEAGGINIFALLGFIFAFLLPLAGLVLSIIGLNQTSRGDGHGHGLALAGLILSIIFLVVAVTIIL